MVAILDFRLIQTLDSFLISFFVLPDIENVGIALEISLLSRVKAEIYVILVLLPVDGRHLSFPTYPGNEQSPHKSLRVALLWKQGCSARDLVAIMYRSWVVRYLISASS